MKVISLRCVSTYFQPPKNHTNATYINIQPKNPPSQIDYIHVSTRWASSVRCCKTTWGPTIDAHGRKYDHAFVRINLHIRPKRQRTSKRKDFSALRSTDVALLHEEHLKAELLKSARPTDATQKWQRLTKAMQSAQTTLPDAKPTRLRKWDTSGETLKLVKERRNKWNKMTEDERGQIKRKISRSARKDYRDYVEGVLKDMEKEESI